MLKDDESVRGARVLLYVDCLELRRKDLTSRHRNHPMESETDVRLIACVELMDHKSKSLSPASLIITPDLPQYASGKLCILCVVV